MSVQIRTSVQPGSRRLRGATIALVAGSALGLSAPALAIAEAMQEICAEGPVSTITCPWYHMGHGPLISNILPPSEQILTGKRSIVGILDGLLPLSSHEVFDDGAGGSRVLLEIIAGLGEGDPNNTADVNLRSRATGVLTCAAGNGTPRDPEPLARGVAFTSHMYAASVGLASGFSNTFTLNVPGMMASLLIMADPVTGARFGVTQPADVIISSFSFVGDSEGEGIIARIHDAIASAYGTTLVAPVGDGGRGPFPPTMPELQFRTVGTPAAAFNTIAVGGTDVTVPPPPIDGGPADGNNGINHFQYNQIWPDSGRGRTDARDWRQHDTSTPSGFRVLANARMGPDIIAPADRLRTGIATGEAAYSRDTALPDPTDPNTPLPQNGPGLWGTSLSCGFVAGAAALLQDAYKAVRSVASGPNQEFSHWAAYPRMHNTVVKALLLNSAKKGGLWTNQGNQGPNATPPLQFTTQPLDTLEGAGQLHLETLFVNFQGQEGSVFVPQLLATLDPKITDPLIATVRIPPVGGDSPDGGGVIDDNPLGGGADPPLGGSRPPPPPPGTGPFIPDPGMVPRPQPPNPPPPPNQVQLIGAIPVHSVGWDFGRIGTGFIDYACQEAAAPGSVFTATLCWNRLETIQFPIVSPTAPFPGLDLSTAETELKLEDMTLRVFLHDGTGGPRFEIGNSVSDWNVTEHVHLVNNSVPAFGLPMVRVQWNVERYNAHPSSSSFVADTQFGVAWRLVQGSNSTGGGNAPPGTPSTSLPGDLNSDGIVNMLDLAIVLSTYGGADLSGDANRDGVVDFSDLVVVLGNFGAMLNPNPTP